MQCADCGRENSEHATFCRGCGSPLSHPCASCGAALTVQHRFCHSCGTRVERPGAGAHGADWSRAERKVVTALFADVKGFTAMSESLDPEDVGSVIDPTIRSMIEAVRRYDGFVAQAMGDGVFALFGAPVAHEDHAQRALHAALDMQAEVRRRAAQGPAIEVRIGVNTGEAVVRTLRKDDQHVDYSPIGHSINLASRMEDLATPGTIRVSEATYRLAEGYFSFRDLGPVTIKGIRDPVRTYEVTGLGSLRTRLEMAEKRGLAGFVGREAELDALAGALERARQGQGGIVAVKGEPGLGKSRLCYEFARGHATRCLLLKTYSVSHGKANAYQAVISLLQHYFGWRPEDDAAARRRRVEEALRALDPALAEAQPYLLHLLGIAEAGGTLTQMDPEIRRTRTFEAIERILRRESIRQPVALIFEDLQWTDRESLAFLAGLSSELEHARILLVVNFRPEYEEVFWSGTAPCTELRLMPLADSGGRELLTALLGASSALNALKQRVLEAGGGNPFFMEEIARELLERGIVRPQPGGAVLTQPLVEIHIPSTVQSVIAARIDRLHGDAKALLQTIAVVGRQFTRGLVQRVAAVAEELAQSLLQHLLDTGFVLQLTAAGEPRYEIRHGLIQEVAYRLLLKEQRRGLHERSAQALEQIYAASLAEHYGELAHHYYNSSNSAKAIEYLALAGQQAALRSANEEAVLQLRRALELLGKLPASPQRDARELSLQLAIGAPLMRSRGWADPEVGRARARALELAEPLKDSPQMFPALFGLWGYALVRAEIVNAHRLAQQAASLADRTGDSGMQVEACRALAPTLYFLGRLAEAREQLARGIALYDRRQHAGHAVLFGQDPCVTCLAYSGVVLWLLGLSDQALAASARSLQLAQELKHPYSHGFALFFAGTLHHQRRDPQRTQESADAAIALCGEHGFPLWRAGATCLRGWSRALRGEADGVEEIRRGLADWRATGAEVTRPYFLAMLAEACLATGRREEGLAAADEGVELAQAHSDLWWHADLLRLRAEAQADVVAAEKDLRACLETGRTQGAPMMELRAAKGLLKLWRRTAREEEARALLLEVHGRFSEGKDSLDLREAAELLRG